MSDIYRLYEGELRRIDALGKDLPPSSDVMVKFTFAPSQHPLGQESAPGAYNVAVRWLEAQRAGRA